MFAAIVAICWTDPFELKKSVNQSRAGQPAGPNCLGSPLVPICYVAEGCVDVPAHRFGEPVKCRWAFHVILNFTFRQFKKGVEVKFGLFGLSYSLG